MMAEKARLFGDRKREAMIMSAASPADQKRYGRQVVGFDNESWRREAKRIVKEANVAKFSQNPDLRQELMLTVGTTLVEASPEDHIWGIGLHRDDPKALSRNTWRGTNWLGEVLTEVRKEFSLAMGIDESLF